MKYRSLFHRSLDVLTCIYNNETEVEAICQQVELVQSYVEELIEKLAEWELIEEYPQLSVSERGKNVLSIYHNYATQLQIEPLIHATVPDY